MEWKEGYFFPLYFPKDLRHLLLEWSLYAYLREPENSTFSCFRVVQLFDRFLAAKFPKVLVKVHQLFVSRCHPRWIMFKNINCFEVTQAIVLYCFGYSYNLNLHLFIDTFLKYLKEHKVGFPTKNCLFSSCYYDRVFNFTLMRYQLVWFEDESKNAIKKVVPLGALLAYLEPAA